MATRMTEIEEGVLLCQLILILLLPMGQYYVVQIVGVEVLWTVIIQAMDPFSVPRYDPLQKLPRLVVPPL